MLGIIICLLAMGFLWRVVRVQEQRVEMRRRSYTLEAVTKELASWDRTKELGFNDVLVWEAAFKEATGALPEGSRTKELEAKHRADMEKQMRVMSSAARIRTGQYTAIAHPYPYENSFEYERRVGAPIRYGYR